MTYPAFLLALQGPLLNAAVGLIVSWGVENVPWFCRLTGQQKRLAIGLLSLIIPLAACALAVAGGYQPADWEASWWPALVAGFTAFVAATMAHVRKLSGMTA